MSKKSKKAREKIRLVSTAKIIDKKTGKERTTGHFYTTHKNKKTMPGKFEIKKFDPVARQHVIYKEAKIK